MVYTLAGQPDEAVQTIDRMIDPPRNFGPPDMNASPIFAKLSDHPRWEELLRKRGTHPEQIAEIPVDDYFPGPGLAPTVPVDAP